MKTTTLFITFLILILSSLSCKKLNNNYSETITSTRDLILDHTDISPDSLTLFMVDSAVNSSNLRNSNLEIIPAWNNWSQDAHNKYEPAIQRRNRYNTTDFLDLLGDYGQPSGWDFDNSGTVALEDILIFLGGYGSSGSYLSDYNSFDSLQWYYYGELVYSGDTLKFKTEYQDGFYPSHEGNLLITCRVFNNGNIIERSGYSFFNSSDPLYDNHPYYNEGALSNLYVGPFIPYQYYLNLTTE